MWFFNIFSSYVRISTQWIPYEGTKWSTVIMRVSTKHAYEIAGSRYRSKIIEYRCGINGTPPPAIIPQLLYSASTNLRFSFPSIHNSLRSTWRGRLISHASTSGWTSSIFPAGNGLSLAHRVRYRIRMYVLHARKLLVYLSMKLIPTLVSHLCYYPRIRLSSLCERKRSERRDPAAIFKISRCV